MSRGVAPSNNVPGLNSIICLLWIRVEESPRSSVLLAHCLAVVVFPHHLGPSIKTAPLPIIFRSIIRSAMRCLYFAITLWFWGQRYKKYYSDPRKTTPFPAFVIVLFRKLRLFCSGICDHFVPEVVTVLFRHLWNNRRWVGDERLWRDFVAPVSLTFFYSKIRNKLYWNLHACFPRRKDLPQIRDS